MPKGPGFSEKEPVRNEKLREVVTPQTAFDQEMAIAQEIMSALQRTSEIVDMMTAMEDGLFDKLRLDPHDDLNAKLNQLLKDIIALKNASTGKADAAEAKQWALLRALETELLNILPFSGNEPQVPVHDLLRSVEILQLMTMLNYHRIDAGSWLLIQANMRDILMRQFKPVAADTNGLLVSELEIGDYKVCRLSVYEPEGSIYPEGEPNPVYQGVGTGQHTFKLSAGTYPYFLKIERTAVLPELYFSGEIIIGPTGMVHEVVQY